MDEQQLDRDLLVLWAWNLARLIDATGVLDLATNEQRTSYEAIENEWREMERSLEAHDKTSRWSESDE